MLENSEQIHETPLVQFIRNLDGENLSNFIKSATNNWGHPQFAGELFIAAKAKPSFLNSHSIDVLTCFNSYVIKVTNRNDRTTQVLSIRTNAVDVDPKREAKLKGLENGLLAPVHASISTKTYLIEVTDFYQKGSLESKCKKQSSNHQSRLIKSAALFTKLAAAYGQIESNDLCFADSKASNWLLTSDKKLIIADAKSLISRDLIVTPIFKPPGINRDSDEGIRASHSYIFGANLFFYLTSKEPTHKREGLNIILLLPAEQAFIDKNNALFTVFNSPAGQLAMRLIQRLTPDNPEERLSLDKATNYLQQIARLSEYDILTRPCNDEQIKHDIECIDKELAEGKQSSVCDALIAQLQQTTDRIEQQLSKIETITCNGKMIYAYLVKLKREEFKALATIDEQKTYLAQLETEVAHVLCQQTNNEFIEDYIRLEQILSVENTDPKYSTVTEQLLTKLKTDFFYAENKAERNKIIEKAGLAQKNINENGAEISRLFTKLNAFKKKCEDLQLAVPKSIENISESLILYQDEKEFEQIRSEIEKTGDINLDKLKNTINEMGYLFTKQNPTYLKIMHDVSAFENIDDMQQQLHQLKKLEKALDNLNDELQDQLNIILFSVSSVGVHDISALWENKFKTLESIEQRQQCLDNVKKIVQDNKNTPMEAITLLRKSVRQREPVEAASSSLQQTEPEQATKLSFSQQSIIANARKSRGEHSEWSEFISACAQLPDDHYFFRVRGEHYRKEQSNMVLDLCDLDNEEQLIDAVSMVLYTLANPVASSTKGPFFGDTKAISAFVEMFNNKATLIDPRIRAAVTKAAGIAPDEKLKVEHFKMKGIEQQLKENCEKLSASNAGSSNAL